MATTNDDVFNIGASPEASSFLTTKTKVNDGLLRAKIEDGKDGKRELTLRILPNLQKNGKLGTTAIEKHIHYANFKQNPELQGYFDCLKNTNIGKECPLCNTYWALTNTNNPTEQDKAKLISRSTKYYAYAYVVEDKQVPENEGKIFIFPFGYKIYQKIKLKAESSRKPVKVEDLIHGANLNLIVQEIGGFYNYDASEFEAPEPIEFGGKQLKVQEDGSISDKERARVMEFLASREFDLETFLPTEWTSEQHDKVDKIVSVLSGVAYTGSSASNAPVSETKKPLTSSAVFDDDDDDDVAPDEEPIVVPTKKVKQPVIVDEDDEDEDEPVAIKPAAKPAAKPASDVVSAKRKASAFFEDDED